MKIDRVIEIVRNYKLSEEMSVGAGGFTQAADAKGPVAGYDKPLNKRRYIYQKNSRKNWLKKDVL